MTPCELLDIQELLHKALKENDKAALAAAIVKIDLEVNDLVVFTDTDSIKVIDKEEIIDGTV